MGIAYSQYNTYLKIFNEYLDENKEKLKKFIFIKDEIYQIFYATDMKLIGENCFYDYTYENIFYKEIFVNDSN